MIKIGLLGSSGRMGKMVQDVLNKDFSDRAIVLAMVAQGEDLAPLQKTDVVIDFSLPEATLAYAQLEGPLPPIAIGATGFDDAGESALKRLGEKTLALRAGNFSQGILVFSHVLERFSAALLELGYQVSLDETHHIHKKDRPSGTAKHLQAVISPENPESVPTYSHREGEVIGDHRVQFEGPGDTITFVHHAKDRSIFARGAIEVALWMATQKNRRGLIGMNDYFREALQRD